MRAYAVSWAISQKILPDSELTAPVYVKIQNGKEDSFIYLEVWAWEKDEKVVVQGRRVNEEETPKLLHSAMPD